MNNRFPNLLAVFVLGMTVSSSIPLKAQEYMFEKEEVVDPENDVPSQNLTVYVTAVDEKGKPMPKMLLMINLISRGKAIENYSAPAERTDKKGKTSLLFKDVKLKVPSRVNASVNLSAHKDNLGHYDGYVEKKVKSGDKSVSLKLVVKRIKYDPYNYNQRIPDNPLILDPNK